MGKNNPDILKENLLIISEQVYLPSGRQPDLIAIDKNGDLVIIELKRDDSGRDVYWQAITYAAQFSEYSYSEIIDMYETFLIKSGKEPNSKERIEEFIEEDLENINQKQKIILVSKEYHQDVLKASLWLLDYGIDIKVVKLTPYKYENNLILLDSEVLIPTPGVEEYIEKRVSKGKETKRSYKTSWWSTEKGTFDSDKLKRKLIESFTRDSDLTPMLIEFVKILLNENTSVKRDIIKEKLFEAGIGSNIGQTGRYLSNISQFLTKKSTPHLRQIIVFDIPPVGTGEMKDNYQLVSEYKNLVREVIKEIEENENN